jgi:Fe(3+) dicitrate transport protein
MYELSDSTIGIYLDGVVIESDRSHKLPDIQGTQIYAGKKTELLYLKSMDANLAMNNTRQIFAKVPGVNCWENDGSGVQVGIAVRGLSPNRSWEFNVRQNGYDVTPDIFGYSEAYYNPTMEAVERIEIIRGAASLQYGPQFGGLMNYILKSAPADKKISFETQNTTGTNKLFSSYNAIGGTINKFSYYAYYHFRRGDGWRENSEYLVQNAYLNLGYAITPKVKLSAEATHFNYRNQQPGGLTDSLFAVDPQRSVRARNWFSTPWWMWNVNAEIKPSDRVTLNWKIYGTKGQRNSVGFTSAINIPDTIQASTLQYSNRQVDRDAYKNVGTEFRSLTRYKLFGQEHALTAGMRYYFASTHRQQQGKGTTGLDYDLDIVTDSFPRDLQFQTHNVALFAENMFHITKDLTITPGIRYEFIHADIAGRYTISGGNPVPVAELTRVRHIVMAGVGLEYRVATSTSLYFNVSQAYRPVGYGDLTPPSTTDVVDQELKDSKGYNIDLGYRGMVKEFLSFDVSAFYLYYNNRIGTIRKFVDDDPTKSTYQFRTNVGATRSAGVEAYIELDAVKAFTENRKFGTVSVFASIGYTNARYKDFRVYTTKGSTPNIIIEETNLKGNHVEYAPEHNHRFGLTYDISRKDKKGNAHAFSTTFQVSYTSAFFTDALNTELPNAAATLGKLDGYTVADWSFTYRFLEKYNFKAGINNFTNAHYATRRSGGYPGPGILPADGLNWFISVGVKI